MQHIELQDPTEQQILDAAMSHMEGMDVRCLGMGGLCVYRSDQDGSRACAIGAFIPDEHPALSSQDSFIMLLRRYPKGSADHLQLWMYKYINILNTLQLTHDKMKTSILKKYCEERGLKYTAPASGFLFEK